MTSVVVTGANGFIGSALLRELSKNGISVFAIVRNSASDTSEIQNLPGVKIIYCELAQLEQLPAMLLEPVDTFYHLAWEGATGNLRGDHALQLKNVEWTLRAVNAADQLGCHRFVGVGSSAEFDVHDYMELSGSTPNITSHYGSAKIAAHYMSKAECSRLKIDHIWAHLANTYGVGDHSSNFVNFAAKKMLTGQPAEFTSGEQLYDFVYVDDIAQGLYRVGDTGKANCSYYVGSTRPRRLKEFIGMIRDSVDPSIQLNFGAIPFNGISMPEDRFDCAQLIKDTGYCPRISFQDGISLTVEWLRKKNHSD